MIERVSFIKRIERRLRVWRKHFVNSILYRIVDNTLSRKGFKEYSRFERPVKSQHGSFTPLEKKALEFASFDDNLRVIIPSLEIQIVYGCNLHCNGCSAFSPRSKGRISYDDVCQWSEAWCNKLRPQYLTLLGGEPLLHNDLDKIIYAVSQFWKDSQVRLITNGLMLPKIKSEVFQAIKETNTSIEISKHYQSDDFDKEFSSALSFLDRENIAYQVRPSHGKWSNRYQIDTAGIPWPYHSNPKNAWDICVADNCMTLMDNKVYRCSILASVARGIEAKFLPPEWGERYCYTPLSADASPLEIRKHLLSQEMPVCGICPEERCLIELSDPRVPFNYSELKKAI